MDNFQYFSPMDYDRTQFFRIPKTLFLHEPYKSELSLNAKVLYGFLADRQELSRSNNWVDSSNRIYLLFSRENMCKGLCVTENTVRKAIKELEKLDLYKEVRQGQGKPNLIYVGKVKDAQTLDNTKTRKIYGTKTVNFTGLNPKEFTPNNTNINNTNINNTKTKDMSKGQSTNTSNNSNKQTTLINGLDTSNNSVSKSSKKGNRTHAQLAADKIADARTGLVNWNKVTNRDFTHYYLEQHNKLFKPISINMYKDIGVIRDDLIGRYSLPPEQVCDVIDTLLEAYKTHPNKWDSLTFNMLQSNRRLVDELMEMVNRKLNPVETKYDASVKTETNNNDLDVF